MNCSKVFRTEALRLSRLVGNLLDMTYGGSRVLNREVELRRDLYPLEEIVGAALQRLEPQLTGREVTVSLPEDLPLVNVDDVLLGQVLVNLIENATKYSPPGSAIENHPPEGHASEARSAGGSR